MRGGSVKFLPLFGGRSLDKALLRKLVGLPGSKLVYTRGAQVERVRGKFGFGRISWKSKILSENCLQHPIFQSGSQFFFVKGKNFKILLVSRHDISITVAPVAMRWLSALAIQQQGKSLMGGMRR